MSNKTDFRHIVSSEMRELSKYDCNGALPYLSLQPKFENVVRDLLAFRLHKKFQEQKFQQEQGWFGIAREKTFKGKKVDIAIFEWGQQKMFDVPVAIIELKAVAQPRTFGAHLEALDDDLRNAKYNLGKSLPDARPAYLGLLFGPRGSSVIPGSNRSV